MTVLLSAKSTGGPDTQEGWKKFRNIINRGLDFENRAYMSMQGRKEQEQVIIKDKTKTYTAVLYIAMKIGRK